jgi:hypothetical protein
MHAGARRGGHRHRHEQREQHLRQVVRLAGAGLHDLAQRPLREQQQHQGGRGAEEEGQHRARV